MNMKPSALALDTDTNGINSWKPNKDVGNLRRRTEDIEYWRQRAGWFNDDESMREYNQGVYDTYYEIDDDGSGRNHRSRLGSSKQREIAKNVLKVTAVLVALGLLVLMCKTLMRRLGSSKREKVSSDSKSRSGRSKSRSRSRSRSRKTSDNNYELMDEDGSRSKRSSRSKSRTRRSRSRSRQRSSSKSRSEKKREEEPVAVEPTVLV